MFNPDQQRDQPVPECPECGAFGAAMGPFGPLPHACVSRPLVSDIPLLLDTIDELRQRIRHLDPMTETTTSDPREAW